VRRTIAKLEGAMGRVGKRITPGQERFWKVISSSWRTARELATEAELNPRTAYEYLRRGVLDGKIEERLTWPAMTYRLKS
jgi:hypothetical protein